MRAVHHNVGSAILCRTVREPIFTAQVIKEFKVRTVRLIHNQNPAVQVNDTGNSLDI